MIKKTAGLQSGDEVKCPNGRQWHAVRFARRGDPAIAEHHYSRQMLYFTCRGGEYLAGTQGTESAAGTPTTGERDDERRGMMAKDMAALLDAFAELRRTWDELVGLQPDILAEAPLSETDLVLLGERVSAHVVAAVALEDQIEIMRAERGEA